MTIEDGDDVFVCRTRDISYSGCFLDTAQIIERGTRVQVAIMDQTRGIAMDVNGYVMRCLPPGKDGLGRGVGLQFYEPPQEWTELVAIYEAEHQPHVPVPRRLRILVTGDKKRQRGAMALYVTSGWDVRFASDLDNARDALSGVHLNAIIVECDLEDERCFEFLDLVQEMQPDARRIVRSELHGKPAPTSESMGGLFHRVVDRNAGLDSLVDALTANMS